MIERHKLALHQATVNAAAEGAWQDYHRRLCLDASAVFDATEEPAQ